MCIKESRYHPLCNGRLDAAPVHDLVPLPVANIKRGGSCEQDATPE